MIIGKFRFLYELALFIFRLSNDNESAKPFFGKVSQKGLFF